MTQSERITVKRLLRYCRAVSEKEGEIPTVAGLANYLGISKQELFSFASSDRMELKTAFETAMNQMEHTLLSAAAFKKIAAAVVPLCLDSDGAKEQPDTEIVITEEGGAS